MLRGAVLGLQDGGDDGDASRPSPEPAEEPPGEGQPHGDQTDNGHGPPSPGKQEQSQHLHLMVELLRPQDDIRLVRAPSRALWSPERGESHSSGGRGEWNRASVCLESLFGEPWCEGRGHPAERRGYPNHDDSAVSARVVLTG